MKTLFASLAILIALATAAACGGDVESGPGGTATTGGQGGSAGGGGGQGGAAPCHPGGTDDAIVALEGQPCAMPDEVCSSNNGCGGCSVTCKNGIWTSTDANICYSVGEGC